MSLIPEPQETRAIAVAGTSLVFGLILRLHDKGILTDAEVDRIFENVLTSLEDFLGAKDLGVRSARILLDSMHQLVAVHQCTKSPIPGGSA